MVLVKALKVAITPLGCCKVYCIKARSSALPTEELSPFSIAKNSLCNSQRILPLDPNVVTLVIDKIEEKFGKMTVTRGKSHECIGIKIDILEDKTVVILMKEHIKSAIAEFPEDIIRNAATTAAKYRFQTRNSALKRMKSFIGL